MGASFIENAIFPTDISNGSVGGPMFVTYVQETASGYEQRIAAWPYGRQYYEVQYGIKKPEQGFVLLKFFQSMKGMTYGFKYLDPFDYKSCDITNTPTATDVTIVTAATSGQATATLFKEYNTAGQITTRPITKPANGTILLEINSVSKTEGIDFTVDYTNGEITFTPVLTLNDVVTVGFQFYVPCRFGIDRLPMSLRGPLISDTQIPVIEIREP